MLHFVRIQFQSRYLSNFRAISSKISLDTLVRLTVRQFSGLCLLPVLRIGLTTAFFQSFANQSWITDRSKRMLEGFATKLADFFSNLWWISSVLMDLSIPSSFSIPRTSSSSMVTMASVWTEGDSIFAAYAMLNLKIPEVYHNCPPVLLSPHNAGICPLPLVL